MYNIFIFDNLIGTEGFHKLLHNLRYISKLSSLFLNCNEIRDSDIISFSNYLNSIPNIRILYLSFNGINDNGIKGLFNNFSKITKLVELNISSMVILFR